MVLEQRWNKKLHMDELRWHMPPDLNTCETKYSVNEFELLAAVWAIDHFKYYLSGRRFTLITDHQALVSALNSNKSNKTYQSRLTRWIDRLLPFDFDIKHLSGSKMVLIDYILRHPVGKQQPPAYWDENFVVALIDDFISCLEFQDSTLANIEIIEKPNGVQRKLQLDRNENFPRSDSHAKSAEFTVNNPLLKNSHSLLNSNSSKHFQSNSSNISNQSTFKKDQKDKNLFSISSLTTLFRHTIQHSTLHRDEKTVANRDGATPV